MITILGMEDPGALEDRGSVEVSSLSNGSPSIEEILDTGDEGIVGAKDWITDELFRVGEADGVEVLLGLDGVLAITDPLCWLGDKRSILTSLE